MAQITADGYTTFTNAESDDSLALFSYISGEKGTGGAYIAGAASDRQSLTLLNSLAAIEPFWRKPQRLIG